MGKPPMDSGSSDRPGEQPEPSCTPPATDSDSPAASRGARCPSCKNPLGYWTLVRSGIPLRTTCPCCRQALQFEGMVPLFIALIVVGFSVGMMSDRLALAMFGTRDLGAMLMAVFVVVAPIQLTLAAYLRRRGKLKSVAAGARPR